eukprot:3126820-Pyramimonas_sp.AAC.1
MRGGRVPAACARRGARRSARAPACEVFAPHSYGTGTAAAGSAPSGAAAAAQAPASASAPRIVGPSVTSWPPSPG